MRRASVNNFGYGGSNAHAIIEHPDYLIPYYRDKLNSTKTAHENQPGRLRILRVSAKSEQSTISQLSNIRHYVKKQIGNWEDADEFLDQLVYTLGQKRSTFPWSTAMPFSTAEDIIDLEPPKPQRTTQTPRIGFVFSGQGAQWYAMGKELIATYPVFRGALQEADNYLRELGASWSLIGTFFPTMAVMEKYILQRFL
jgi:acyl transferase domain-containing protein